MIDSITDRWRDEGERIVSYQEDNDGCTTQQTRDVSWSRWRGIWVRCRPKSDKSDNTPSPTGLNKLFGRDLEVWLGGIKMILHSRWHEEKERTWTHKKRRTCTDSVEGSVSTTLYLFERLQGLLPKGKIRKNVIVDLRDKSPFKSGNLSKYHEGEKRESDCEGDNERNPSPFSTILDNKSLSYPSSIQDFSKYRQTDWWFGKGRDLFCAFSHPWFGGCGVDS